MNSINNIGKRLVCKMAFVAILGMMVYAVFLLLVAFYYGFLSTPYPVIWAGEEIIVGRWWDVLLFGLYLYVAIAVYGLFFTFYQIKEKIKRSDWMWIWVPALGALGYFIALMTMDPLLIEHSLEVSFLKLLSTMGGVYALVGTFIAITATKKRGAAMGFICGISASFSIGLCVGVIKGMGLGFMALAYALMGNILGISAAVVIIWLVRGMVWLKREGWPLEIQEEKK